MDAVAHDPRSAPVPCCNGKPGCFLGEVAHEQCTVLSADTAASYVETLVHTAIHAMRRQRDDGLERLGIALEYLMSLRAVMHEWHHEGDLETCQLDDCAAIASRVTYLRGHDHRLPAQGANE